MPEQPPNKRRFPRISSEHTVLVKKLGPEVTETFVKTRQVGLGGCMFINEAPLEAGTIIEMLISVNLRVVTALARVVYEIPNADGGSQIGVEFVEISPADREVIEGLFKDPSGTTVAP